MAYSVVHLVTHSQRRRLATQISSWLLALTLVTSNAFLLAPDGSPLRVIAALLFILLPGLAWAELLLFKAESMLRWTIGCGLGFALAIVTGMALHAFPGPILLWQWVAAVDLLVLMPVAGLLLLRSSARDEIHAEHDRRNIVLRLAAILLLGSIFRFAELNYSEYQGDEIEAVAPAARAIEGYEDALTLQRRKAPAEVLLPMLVWRTAGVLTEGTARLPFAVAGLLIVACSFLMGCRLLSSEAGRASGLAAGVATALAVALCGLLVAFSRAVQYQSIVVLMMALSMLCAWEWRARGSLRWAVLAGSFLGIGLLAHYDALALAPALAYFALAAVLYGRSAANQSRWRMMAGSLVMAGACLVVASPFYIAYLADPSFAATGSYLAGHVGDQVLKNNFAHFLQVTSFYNSFYFVVLMGLLAWIGMTWLLLNGREKGRLAGKGKWGYLWLSLASILIWLGIWRFVSFQLAVAAFIALLSGALFSRAVSEEQRSVLIWGGCAFLAFVFFFQNPGTHVYVIMLPLALLAGMGAGLVWNGFQGRNAKGVAVAVTAAAVLIFSGYLYAAYLRQDVEYWQDWPASRMSFYWVPEEYAERSGYAIFGMVHRSGWKAAGAWLHQVQNTIAYDSNEKPAVTAWYMRNAPRPSRGEQDFCGKKAHTIFVADDLVDSTGAYAVTPAHLAGYRRIGRITQANGKGMAVYSLPGAVSAPADLLDGAELEAAFDSTATPGAFVSPVRPQHQVNANLDNKVLLLGYDLDCVTPDGKVALTSYWQAMADLGANYYMFLHMTGGLDSGSPPGIWGQSDGVPGNVSAPILLWDASRLLAGQPGGAEPLPTSRWRRGQVIRDRRTFQILPETPQGNYTLLTGLYDPQTGERLPVLDAQDQAVSNYVSLLRTEILQTANLAAGEGP